MTKKRGSSFRNKAPLSNSKNKKHKNKIKKPSIRNKRLRAEIEKQHKAFETRMDIAKKQNLENKRKSQGRDIFELKRKRLTSSSKHSKPLSMVAIRKKMSLSTNTGAKRKLRLQKLSQKKNIGKTPKNSDSNDFDLDYATFVRNKLLENNISSDNLSNTEYENTDSTFKRKSAADRDDGTQVVSEILKLKTNSIKEAQGFLTLDDLKNLDTREFGETVLAPPKDLPTLK